jgi:exopolysaccharide production protein ExoQ
MILDDQVRPSSRIVAVAMFLYAASLIKFFDRDPLSAEVGPQGPIELMILVIVALILLAFVRKHRLSINVPTPAKAFLVFGCFALASSVFSFYPMLSLAKAVSFILACAIAVLACSAVGPATVFKYLYYSIVIVLALDLVAKVASGTPILDVDDYNGRIRLSLFGIHPTLLGELTAVTLLVAFILPVRPRLYYQAFLFALNVAADSRTSTNLLIILLIAIWLVSHKRDMRSLVVLFCCAASLSALLLGISLQANSALSAALAPIIRPLYGDTFTSDLSSVSGRTDVWEAAAPAIAHSIFLGYGLGGSRDVLVNNSSWNWVAGDAHNAYIDLLLGGGFPAVLVVLLGWAGAVKRAWQSRGAVRYGSLAIYSFIAGFGMVAPNLTNLQGFSTLLIITIDLTVCADLACLRSQDQEDQDTVFVRDVLESPIGA